MRGERSFNRKAMKLFLLLSLLSGLLIVALFYIVQMHHIRAGAAKALRRQFAMAGLEQAEKLPDCYYVFLEDEEFMTEPEREMSRLCKENPQEFPLYKIHHFSYQGSSIYFCLADAQEILLDAEGILLVYVDMSFAVNMVRTAAAILAGASGVLCLILFWAERRTVGILDEKDRSMKEFFSNASHELKTPLMAIRGYAEGMEQGVVSWETAYPVMIRETERMEGLIHSILEFSKLDSGMRKPRMLQNDVREILYDAIGIIEPAAQKRGIQMIVRLPEPVLFYCDEEMLFSACSNIMTNCVRYAKTSITAEIFRQTDPGLLRICIGNDGETISKQDLEHMFDRFYKGAGGQSGLGMALSLEYVRLQGGNITVRSQEGHTVFEIVLREDGK